MTCSQTGRSQDKRASQSKGRPTSAVRIRPPKPSILSPSPSPTHARGARALGVGSRAHDEEWVVGHMLTLCRCMRSLARNGRGRSRVLARRRLLLRRPCGGTVGDEETLETLAAHRVHIHRCLPTSPMSSQNTLAQPSSGASHKDLSYLLSEHVLHMLHVAWMMRKEASKHAGGKHP